MRDTAPGRALGHGVSALIPADADGGASAAARARAALAAVQSVSVPLVIVEAAAGLLDQLADADQAAPDTRQAARETAAYLRNL
ncbi:hypothetical protein [Streptomyces syringium]|uniref:hypothetical protein n=1 Tax=Streptomyces syringium TaxID=76729 RepID=UPI0033C1CD87